MNGSFLDTGLFLESGYIFPVPILSLRIFALAFGFTMFLLLGYRYYEKLRREKTVHREHILLSTRYERQIRGLSLQDTRYAEKLSLIIRKYLDEERILLRALSKTGKEIRAEQSDIFLSGLTALLDRGSYSRILTHKERQEARRTALLSIAK